MTSSVAGYLGQAGIPMYNASKHGVVALMRSLRHSLPKLGLAISVVAPAMTITNITKQFAKDSDKYWDTLRKGGIAINTADAPAKAVCWLSSLGVGANGKGIFVQGNEFTELERTIALSRGTWMGQRAYKMYHGGGDLKIYDRDFKSKF